MNSEPVRSVDRSLFRMGFVCTNYNNSKFTREAVRSLVASDGVDYHVVIVDNCSDKDSIVALRKLAKEYSNVDLVLNEANIGYFKGLNCGIRHLRSAQPDIEHIIVGNNDLVFPADFSHCVRKNLPMFADHAVISPDIVTLDGIHQNPHVIHAIGRLRELVYDIYYSHYYLAVGISELARLTRCVTDRKDEAQHNVAQVIYQGYGACYILGPLFFSHFSELWAPTFLMGEEYFLSKQLSDAGLHVYYEPSIRVLHHCHATVGNTHSRKLWEMSRDAHRIYRKYVKILD